MTNFFLSLTLAMTSFLSGATEHSTPQSAEPQKPQHVQSRFSSVFPDGVFEIEGIKGGWRIHRVQPMAYGDCIRTAASMNAVSEGDSTRGSLVSNSQQFAVLVGNDAMQFMAVCSRLEETLITLDRLILSDTPSLLFR